MDDLLKEYSGIIKHFGEDWVNNTINHTHPLFRILHEKVFLEDLNKYLKDLDTKKSITDQIHNKDQFWDICCELEIYSFLKQIGLKPKLHEKIEERETDILLEEQNLDLEITHLNIPNKVKDAMAHYDPEKKKVIDGKVVDLTYLNMERMRSYLDKKKFQKVYPTIVCFCTHIAGGYCYDLENLVKSDTYHIPEQVCALAIWKSKSILCLRENP
jgi:hypothetical protein